MIINLRKRFKSDKNTIVTEPINRDNNDPLEPDSKININKKGKPNKKNLFFLFLTLENKDIYKKYRKESTNLVLVELGFLQITILYHY